MATYTMREFRGGRGEPDSTVYSVSLSGTGAGAASIVDSFAVPAAVKGYSYGFLWITAISGTGTSLGIVLTNGAIQSGTEVAAVSSGALPGAADGEKAFYLIGSKTAANGTPWMFAYLPNFLGILITGTSGAISMTVEVELHRLPFHNPSHVTRR